MSRSKFSPSATLVIGLGLVSLAAAARAQVRVTPIIQMLETRRGATTVFNVQIGNQGQATVNCTMGVGDMALSPQSHAEIYVQTSSGRAKRALGAVIRHSPAFVCRAIGELFYGSFG